jgi:cell division protein FtsA
VLHVLPQQYIVDDQDGIRDPLGMAGVRLEAKVHIVTTLVASAQNVIRCANRCNLQVADIVLESLASSQAVLEDDEKELGVALVDIGGGTCDVMVYSDGAIVHTSVLPLGGGHITNDIATVLRTPLDSAEKIKKKYGCAWRGHVETGETMEVPSVGGRGPRVLPRIKLVEVIEPRVEEIFEHVKKELMRCGYYDGLAAGIVLTGGATAMDGVCEIAEQVIGLPTRRGAPTKIAELLDRCRPRDVRRRAGSQPADQPQRRSPEHVQACVGPDRRDFLERQREREAGRGRRRCLDRCRYELHFMACVPRARGLRRTDDIERHAAEVQRGTAGE